MVVSNNGICVVWDDDTSGNTEVFHVYSIDGGKTFAPPKNLSNNSGESRNPAITASGGDVYIVWDDDTLGNAEIFYAMSQDGGQTFSSPQNLSQNQGRSILPAIVATEGRVDVVWQDDTPGNREILYTQSPDGGRTFSAPRNLSQDRGRSLSPAIAATGTNVYVVWDDNTPGNHEVFFTQSPDGGQSFIATRNLSNTSSFSAAPDIAASEDHVYVTWTEELTPENYEILFSQSSDGGNRFTSPRNISQSPTYSGASVVAASGEDVYLIWIEGLLQQRHGKPYVDYEALYAHSSASGGKFAIPQNISASEGATVNPALAVSGKQILMVYADETPGNFEIFFFDTLSE